MKRVCLLCGWLGLVALPLGAEPGMGDRELIATLLAAKLDERQFAFADVVAAVAGKQVIPLREEDPIHRRVVAAVENAAQLVMQRLSAQDHPIQKVGRINEVSRYVEDGMRVELNRISGLRCDIPPTLEGTKQRSGYPDMRVVDTASGSVFYVDPKLVESAALDSTLRSFYFEPKDRTLKITQDAVHLVCGIEHNGQQGAWRFTRCHVVDLSQMRCHLKAEFQASNAVLYSKSAAK